mmetsp:Transcript_4328/g.13228  ORF Transcript_4328/g.13228 Transcript_4328/m.13228 type:complete len:231 (+) Transcript_4328:1642-2334(+)
MGASRNVVRRRRRRRCPRRRARILWVTRVWTCVGGRRSLGLRHGRALPGLRGPRGAGAAAGLRPERRIQGHPRPELLHVDVGDLGDPAGAELLVQPSARQGEPREGVAGQDPLDAGVELVVGEPPTRGQELLDEALHELVEHALQAERGAAPPPLAGPADVHLLEERGGAAHEVPEGAPELPVEHGLPLAALGPDRIGRSLEVADLQELGDQVEDHCGALLAGSLRMGRR